MTQLIKRINDDEINARIIQCASAAEYNLIHGRRDIKHIDYFVAGAMKELRKSTKNKNSTNKDSINKIIEV